MTTGANTCVMVAAFPYGIALPTVKISRDLVEIMNRVAGCAAPLSLATLLKRKAHNTRISHAGHSAHRSGKRGIREDIDRSGRRV